MERDDIYTQMTTMWIQGLDTSWLSMEKVQKHAQRNDMWKKMKILRKMLENGKYCTIVICWLSRKEETKNGFLR